MDYRRIVYTPPEDSHYTGFLNGAYYVDGKQVSEREFRKDTIEKALKRAKEIREGKSNDKGSN